MQEEVQPQEGLLYKLLPVTFLHVRWMREPLLLSKPSSKKCNNRESRPQGSDIMRVNRCHMQRRHTATRPVATSYWVIHNLTLSERTIHLIYKVTQGGQTIKLIWREAVLHIHSRSIDSPGGAEDDDRVAAGFWSAAGVELVAAVFCAAAAYMATRDGGGGKNGGISAAIGVKIKRNLLKGGRENRKMWMRQSVQCLVSANTSYLAAASSESSLRAASLAV